MTTKHQPQLGTGKSSARPIQQAADPKLKILAPDISKPAVLAALGDQWLSPQTVADGIQSCVATVLRAFRRNELAGHKLTPRLIRFRRSDVLDWLNRARV